MKNILVPIDFSPHSKAAFTIAYDLASRINATLNVFHVIENPKTSVLLPDLYLKGIPNSKNFNENLIQLAEEKIQQWIAAKNGNTEVKIHAYVGSLNDEFKKYTKANQPDLIVMGVKGYSDKSLNTIGSFTEKNIKKLDYPVLTVKSDFAKREFSKIAMIADFIENEATIAFEIKRLNKLFGAHVEIVHINTPQDFESDKVLETKFQVFVDKYLLENCTLVTYNHYNKEEGIILAAKKLKVDLIAIASQSKSMVDRLLPFTQERAIGEDFIESLEYPIWIFRSNFKLPTEASFVDELMGPKFSL
ncbi:universal stress protein [Fulvivirga ligni]|uniref:universal stress protein n=1 Tax=Fulvivirga ligni TaxID=2904246 RepID=UPI001F3B055A|nr:universal stress protein [Fulvivirga ligni]UII21558.1 universal stress protein [Fulvivirga ligni]